MVSFIDADVVPFCGYYCFNLFETLSERTFSGLQYWEYKSERNIVKDKQREEMESPCGWFAWDSDKLCPNLCSTADPEPVPYLCFWFSEMRTVLLNAFQPSCPWHRSHHGRAQSHQHSQYPTLAPPFSASNPHSCCAALCFSFSQQEHLGHVFKQLGKNPFNCCQLIPPGEAPWCPYCWGYCLQTGSTLVLERIHQDCRDFRNLVSYIQSTVFSTHFATIDCFVPLEWLRAEAIRKLGIWWSLCTLCVPKFIKALG